MKNIRLTVLNTDLRHIDSDETISLCLIRWCHLCRLSQFDSMWGLSTTTNLPMLIYWSFDKKTLLDDEAEAQKLIFVFS